MHLSRTISVISVARGRSRFLTGLFAALVVAVGAQFASANLPAASARAAQAGSSAIVINEIFYNPDGQDEGHEFIELYNRSGQSIDVSGWAFTTGIDHVIADQTTLAAGAHFVIARDAEAFRTVFGFDPAGDYAGSLSNGGETLTLVNSAGVVIDTVTWDDLAPWPVGADGDGDSVQLLDPAGDNDDPLAWGGGAPTPRAANSVRLDVIANIGRGWYDGDQFVTLTATRPDAQIFFTTSSGSVNQSYSGPIRVADNGGVRVIRAEARVGNLRSPVVSHTYVFKPDRGIPVVATWPNPVSVAPGQSEDTITFEFVPPPSTGLSSSFGYAGSEPSSGGIDAGQSDKIFFRGAYGNGTLAGDLFGDFYYGIEPATEFDQLFLRDEHLDGTHLRQIMAHDALLAMGQLSPHGRFVEYYTDGSDRGVRHLQERPEGGFMETYTDIDKDEWLAWSRNEGGLGRSTMGAGYSNYAEAQEILNVESLVDFSLVQWQANVEDYRSVKNFRTAGPTSPNAGDADRDGADYRFHFFNWDMDIGYNANLYGRGAPNLWAWADFVTPDYVMHSIDQFDEFALFASDRIACAFYDGGPLTAQAWRPRLEARRAELVRAGGANASSFTNSLDDWIDERNAWLLNRFRRSQHTTNVYNTQRADAPPYKPPSAFEGPLLAETSPVSVVLQGAQLVLSNGQGGDLYYRLDGGDPRTPTGQISPDAIRYNGPVALATGRHEVIARAFDSSQSDVRDRWTPACNDPAVFDISGQPGSLVINELHYNPIGIGVPADPNHVDGDRFEFLEIYNPTNSAVGIGGFSFSEGIDFVFPSGTSLGARQYVVLASDSARFTQRYGFAPAGDYSGNLSDGGEAVTLVDSRGTTMDSVTYDDAAPWAVGADAQGPSLSLVDPALDNALPGSWRVSTVDAGSPRAENVTFEIGDVDGSGAVTDADVQAILAHLAGNNPEPFIESLADLDGSGTIDLLDALILAQAR